MDVCVTAPSGEMVRVMVMQGLGWWWWWWGGERGRREERSPRGGGRRGT